MCAQILNSIGLVSAIIGTCLVFKWALTLQSDSYGVGLEDGNIVDTKWGRIKVIEAKAKGKEERARYKRYARCGLFLIGAGFLFQLLAVWVPTK
jgi:hypothetical protein